MLPTEM